MGNQCSVHADDGIRLKEWKQFKEPAVMYSSKWNPTHQLRWYTDTFFKWEQSLNYQGVADFLVAYFGVDTLMFMSDLYAFVELEFDFDYASRVFQLVKSPAIVQSVSLLDLSVERKIIHSAAKMNLYHFLPITIVLKSAKVPSLSRMKTVVVSDPRDTHDIATWQDLFHMLPKGSPMFIPSHIHLNRFGNELEKSSLFKAFCFSALRVQSLHTLHDSHIILVYCFSGSKPCEVKALMAYDVVPIGYLRKLKNKVYFPRGYDHVQRKFSKSESSRLKAFRSRHPYDECGIMKVVCITETKLALALAMPFISDESSMVYSCQDEQMDTERAFRELQQLKI